MTTPASRVRAALADLVAGLDPADGSESAARAVCAALCAADVYETASPYSCPVANYLRAACGITAPPGTPDAAAVLVGETRVVVRGPREGGAAGWEVVDLPPVVKAAVALIGARRVAGLIRGAA